MLNCLGGFLHPIIHLGFGVEFKQPAITAEALAQAATHDEWIGELFHASEEAAKKRGKTDSKSMVQLLDEIRADKKLSTAAHWDDGNKIRDGILARAKDEMIKYASEWTVKEDELEEKTAEMTNAASKLNIRKGCKSKRMEMTLPSILYRWRPAPTKADQIRLLLHALRQLHHLLLCFLEATMDKHG